MPSPFSVGKSDNLNSISFGEAARKRRKPLPRNNNVFDICDFKV